MAHSAAWYRVLDLQAHLLLNGGKHRAPPAGLIMATTDDALLFESCASIPDDDNINGSSNSNEDECAICLDSLLAGSAVVVVSLSCGHRMHSHCLALWMASSNPRHCQCPFCRSPIGDSVETKRRRVADHGTDSTGGASHLPAVAKSTPTLRRHNVRARRANQPAPVEVDRAAVKCWLACLVISVAVVILIVVLFARNK